jgi:hypothetical protein
LSEVDFPLAKFGRQIIDRSADFRMAGKDMDALTNRLNRPLGCTAALQGEEIVQTGYITERCALGG